MSIPLPDQPFVRWAAQRNLAYYYTDERGLPENCLKLFIGVITAYIHQGKLIHVAVDSAGEMLDEMMYEFLQLFALCSRHDAYLRQLACCPAGARSAGASP